MKTFFSLSYAQTLQDLRSNREGLSNQEAITRAKQSAPNRLPEASRHTLLRLFASQFKSLLVYILIAAAGISFFLGHQTDAIFIGVVILINAFVGTFQEYRAARTLAFLRSSTPLRAKVVRDSKEQEIDASQLVTGDIVLVRLGDKLPADLRLIETNGLTINESSLTGESLSVTKQSELSLPENTPLAERTNMAYMGTLVEDGEGTGVIVAVGEGTEMGKIARMVKDTEEPETPLQKKLDKLGRMLSIGILCLVAVLVIVGVMTGEPFSDIFVTSLALAVSALPPGLPVVITIILVVGMRRLLAHKALVKKLNVAETLGSTTVICTDKTGTLTQGKMQVSHILTGLKELAVDAKGVQVKDPDDTESDITALKIALITSDAFIENPNDELHQWRINGRPTEQALLVAATQAGLRKTELAKEEPILKEFPFDSAQKFSACITKRSDTEHVFSITAAPEVIIAHATLLDIDGNREPIHLRSDEFAKMQEKSDELARQGLRILATAYRVYNPGEVREEHIEDLLQELVFVGFIALKDPVRPEAKEALRLTKQAGIRTIIVTGDHAYTAQAVAKELGLSISDEHILDGVALEKLSEKELEEKAAAIELYARVSPEHKIRIVKALQKRGEVVAMLGDGVNDAPSLQGADIGIAVGSATDIAKEASDMILLDGNFNTVVKAVEEGRQSFENIRKALVYLVADDLSEVCILFATVLLGMPLALLPAQILFVDLVEDTFPAAALIFGKERRDLLMSEKPRGLKDPILNRAYLKWLVAIFFIGGSALVFAYYSLLSITGDIELTRTFVFALTAIDSLVFALIVSSLRRSVFRTDLLSNRYLVVALVLGTLFIAGAVYLPFMQQVLSTVPLTPAHWLGILAISAAELVLLEATKYWFLVRRSQTVPA